MKRKKKKNTTELPTNKQTKIHLSSVLLKPLQHYLCTPCQGADLHWQRPFDAFIIKCLILKMLKQMSNFTPVNSIYSYFMVKHLAISSILEVLSLDIWIEGWETQQAEMFLTSLYLSFSHHFFLIGLFLSWYEHFPSYLVKAISSSLPDNDISCSSWWSVLRNTDVYYT